MSAGEVVGYRRARTGSICMQMVAVGADDQSTGGVALSKGLLSDTEETRTPQDVCEL